LILNFIGGLKNLLLKIKLNRIFLIKIFVSKKMIITFMYYIIYYNQELGESNTFLWFWRSQNYRYSKLFITSEFIFTIEKFFIHNNFFMVKNYKLLISFIFLKIFYFNKKYYRKYNITKIIINNLNNIFLLFFNYQK
jgi:hypothetical protein